METKNKRHVTPRRYTHQEGIEKESNHSMEELAKRLSALEKEAFTEFGRIFGPKFVCLFVRKYGLAQWDAKNLAISCVTDISLKVREYYQERDDGCFKAWVFTLAKRKAIDWLRKHNKRSRLFEEIVERIRCGDDEEIRPNEETISAVREAIGQLSGPDQEIVRLRFFEGKTTFREIGETLKIKSGTARVRYTRAIKRLKDALKTDHRIRELLTNGKKGENPTTNE